MKSAPSTEEAARRRASDDEQTARRRAEDEAALIIALSQDLICIAGLDGRFRQVNPSFERVLGYTADELYQRPFIDLVHPEDRASTLAEIARIEAGETSCSFQNRYRTRSGGWRWLEWNSVLSADERVIYAVARDLTERRQLLEQSTGERDVLESLARGAPLGDALSQLLLAYERIFPGMKASVLLLSPDGRRLRHAAAPSLPPEYCQAIDGTAIGPQVGSCGTAAFTRRPVFVSDISQDPLWTDYRQLAETHGLRSCWSVPILSREGEVLGTFAMYYHEPREVQPEERNTIERGVHLTGLIIERHRLFEHLKSTAESLREQERRQLTLISNLPGIAYRCLNDRDYTIEFISTGFRDMTGYSPEQVMSGEITYADLIHPEDRERVWNEIQRALARGERFRIEYRIRTSSGDERWVREQGCGVWDENDQVVALEGFIQDITERRLANEALRQSEQRLRALVEEARDAVMQLSPRFVIESLNAAYETLTGWPRVRWLGRLFFELVHEDDRGRGRELMESVLRGERVPPFELRLLRPAGNPIPMEFTAAPEFADGQIAGVMAIGRDLTVRKQLETQLMQAQKMESVGQLAGGVAHDFNNILAVILMQASLIEAVEKPSPGIREGLEQIKLAAERAAGLTRQLLTFSRRQQMELRDIDLSQVVDDLGKMLRRILGEDIELQTRSVGQLPLIHADVGMLEQVIMNLVVNARDAMPRGGRLTITTSYEARPASGTHAPVPAQDPGSVVLSVSDTGGGIPPEVLPRIFEPFFTTKDVGKGTGLGLATVYGIVRQHGGSVEVKTEVGRGSTFRVLLPSVQLRTKEKGRVASRIDLRGGDETILVVEDETAVRALVRAVLEQKGYRVVEAVSGVAALGLWQQRQMTVDLLLTDMVMPDGVSGRELAERLQADQPGLPVIYTSGYSADAVAQGFALVEGVNFLQKPYGPLKLLTAVRGALDRKTAR
jgi:two-component system, cell cycle sensor histidine kinase and response regulator CckA